MEHGPGAKRRQLPPTVSNCTTLTCSESVFAAHGTFRAGLAVKGSGVRIPSAPPNLTSGNSAEVVHTDSLAFHRSPPLVGDS